MARKIILITGGERSGKSSYAEKRALEMDDHPVYMATARIWDEEFRLRVERHRQRRGPQWEHIEEEKALHQHNVIGRTVLVDCVTLWATNFFFDQIPAEDTPEAGEQQVIHSLDALKEEFNSLVSQDATFLFVTNEIGSGGISPHPVQRRFTDLLGWFNQYIAQKADEVILLVSGIPVKIK